MNPHYAQVAERAGHRCEYCRAPEAIFNFAFEVEHIVPPGLGGPENGNNRALSCRSCNLFKSNKLDAIDPRTGRIVPLFNPRQDLWEEHFRVDQRSGELLGLTSIGRATIDRLRMNRATQLDARRHWMRLRLFS